MSANADDVDAAGPADAGDTPTSAGLESQRFLVNTVQFDFHNSGQTQRMLFGSILPKIRVDAQTVIFLLVRTC